MRVEDGAMQKMWSENELVDMVDRRISVMRPVSESELLPVLEAQEQDIAISFYLLLGIVCGWLTAGAAFVVLSVST